MAAAVNGYARRYVQAECVVEVVWTGCCMRSVVSDVFAAFALTSVRARARRYALVFGVSVSCA